MKRLAMVCGLAAAVLATAPVCAQRNETPPLTVEEPALPVLRQAAAAADDKARLALVDRALAMLAQPTPFRGYVLCVRAATLEQMGQFKEARQDLDRCRALRPDDPRVLLAIGFDESREKRPVSAARLILRAGTIEPRVLDTVDSAAMVTVLRQLRYAAENKLADTLTDALVEAGFARSDPQAFSGLAESAIQSRLNDGNVAGANALLPSVVAPDAGVEMLIDRQFSAIWPAVEQWAGSDLSVQRRALLNGARATFELSGTAAARLAYANALVKTGRRADAIALIDEWLDGAAETTDDDPWERNMAILQQARWIAETGKRAEAIKRMRAALKPGSDKKLSEGQQNIVPNLVVQQLLAHDYAGAKATLDQFTPPDDLLESPAAAGFFAALRACTQQGLGKHDEAVALLHRVQTVYATTFGAVNYAVGCVGSPDEQARHWIERVQDMKQRSGALVGLATARYRLAKGLPSRTLEEDMLRRIEARADVRQTFDRLARPLPATYEAAFDDFNTAPAPRTSDPGPLA